MKLCKNCNTQISDDAKFCELCGKEQTEQSTGNIYTESQPQPIIINNNITALSSTNQDNISPKSQMVDLILCIFLGLIGIHKFYEGKPFKGIIYMFTCGLFGIGWIADIITIACGNAKDVQGRIITEKANINGNKISNGNRTFYKETWFVIFALILYFPAGLILMWVFKKFTKKTRIIISIIVGLCALLGIGYLYSTGAINVNTTGVDNNIPLQSGAQAPAAVANEPTTVVTTVAITEPTTEETTAAPLQMSAVELAHAFNDNEVNANSLYKGKLVAVTGEIELFSDGWFDTSTIYLTTNTGDTVSKIRCSFSSDEKSNVAKLSKGQTVTIIGKVDGVSAVGTNAFGGTLNGVDLLNCKVQ